MNPPFLYPERVPLSAVDRLLNNFASFQQSVTALAEPGAQPDMQAANARWQRASVLLADEHRTLQAEAEAFRSGECEPLLAHASQLRLLTRRMNGYDLASAGDAAETLAQQRQLLVLTAWQIAAAASGSEAAGL